MGGKYSENDYPGEVTSLVENEVTVSVMHRSHSIHWGINPSPLKSTTPSFRQPSLLNLQTVQDPLFRQFLLYIGFPQAIPPLKIRFFKKKKNHIKTFHP